MTSFISSSIFIVATLLLSSVGSTFVNKCTGTAAANASKPDVVNIKDCGQPPCIFYIGSTGVMTIQFKSPRYLENIAPSAVAQVLGLTVPYPLSQTDACDGITNTPCPLAEGEFVEYTFGMDILSIFPAVTLNLEFSLVDRDRGNEAFECFKVDLELANP